MDGGALAGSKTSIDQALSVLNDQGLTHTHTHAPPPPPPPPPGLFSSCVRRVYAKSYDLEIMKPRRCAESAVFFQCASSIGRENVPALNLSGFPTCDHYDNSKHKSNHQEQQFHEFKTKKLRGSGGAYSAPDLNYTLINKYFAVICMFLRPWNGCQQIESLAYTQYTAVVITICSGLYKRQSSYLLLPPMGVPAGCIPIVCRIVKYDVRACTMQV